MKWPLSPTALLSLIFLLVLLIGDVFVAYSTTSQLRENTAEVTQTHEVMDALSRIHSNIADAQTGQRGYIITGLQSYLEPYRKATEKIQGELQRLAALNRLNPLQQSNLKAVQALILEKLAYLDKTIKTRDQDGFDRARDLVAEGEGKRTMETIRGKLAEMYSAEQKLLITRGAAADRSYWLALLSGAMTAFAAIALALATAYFYWRDVRTRERGRAELYEQREWFRTTLSSIGDAVIVTDASGGIQFLNEVARKLTGWSPSDAAGRPLAEVFQILNEESRQRVEDPVTNVFELDGIASLAQHTVLIARDGTEVSIDDSAAPIRGTDGKIVGVVLVFRDISERRGAEARLLASERQLRLITDTAPVYLARIDTQHRYLFVNRAYVERFGLERDEVIGKRVAEVVGEDAYATFKTYIDRALAGETVEFEVDIPYQGSGVHYLHVTYVPERDAQGKIPGIVAVIMDISHRKRGENELKQSNRRKDEFLAMLGHELRNPLAAIRTAAEIMGRLDLTDPQLDKARGIIERQVEHLTRLVDDLLDVSRITQGKITLQNETLELSPILLHAVETTRSLIDARAQSLVIDLPSQPVYVHGDAVRLAQVFGNVLNNAAKYTPERGSITISVGLDIRRVQIRVRDNGVGIAPELLPHVFDLFTQAERAEDRAHGGLGIGLTLVRRLVELQDGNVSAISDGQGKGSEFCIELRRAEQPDALVPASTSDRVASNGPRKILVVDDNVDSAESVAMVLELDGHELRIAHDGEMALAIAKSFQPNIVLLDIGLPGLNGYQVAERLRASCDIQPAILIAVTGYGQTRDQLRAKESGFDYHLIKPVDLEVLETLINSTE